MVNSIQTCFGCDLCLSRKTIVNGHGNHNANVMIIADSPNYHDDKIGTTLNGKVGNHFRHYLNYLNIDDANIWFTYAVKCRTPNNRKPHSGEIKACTNHILYELKEVDPKLVLLVGSTALTMVTRQEWLKVSKVRGKFFTLGAGRFKYLSTFSASAALKDKTKRPYVIEDITTFGNLYKTINPFHKFNINALKQIKL